MAGCYVLNGVYLLQSDDRRCLDRESVEHVYIPLMERNIQQTQNDLQGYPLFAIKPWQNRNFFLRFDSKSICSK